MKNIFYYSKIILAVAVFFATGLFVRSADADAPIYSPGDVLINEFITDPSTGSEWYELLNATGGDIDLSGWTLDRASTSDSISLSGTLPANGILVFSTTTSSLNDAGDLLTLKDSTTATISSVSYGEVTTDPELLIPYLTAPGVDESGYVPDPMSPATYSTTVSFSKGWFNNAGGPPPIAPTLLGIDSQLEEPGVDIVSNIGELENPSATPATEGAGALYFEKIGKGKMVFEQSLNLTDPETVAALQNLSTAMEITDGHVKFDSITANAMTFTGAKIYLYGFPYETTPDIIIRDDDGNILGTNDPSFVGSILYDAGTLSFTAAHFTQFDVPDNAAIDADYASLTEDTLKGGNESFSSTTMALVILPTSGTASSSEITWASSDESIVSFDGQSVNRPIFSSGNASVVLTATITKGIASTTKAFNLTVLRQDASVDTVITSSLFSIVMGEGDNGIISDVTYGTSTVSFLAALTKNEIHQTWNSSGITDPVAEGNTLVVTAENGVSIVTYTVSSLIPNIPTNLQMNPVSPASTTQPTFSWDPVVNDPVITYYETYISYGEGISSTTPDNSYTVDISLEDNVYNWKVRACTESSICSSWSADQSFTIDTEAPSVSVLGDGTSDYQLSSTCESVACSRGDIYGDPLSFSEALTSSAKTAVEDAINAGASVAPRIFMWSGSTLRIYATEEISFADDVTANVIDLAGNTATNLLLIDSDNTAPTVGKWGDGTEDVTIDTSSTANMTFDEALSSGSRTVVENALTAGADRAITFAWDEGNSVLTVTGNDTGVTTFVNDVEVTVTDLNGNTATGLLIVDSVLASTQVAPETAEDGTGDVTIDDDTPEVVITDPEQEVDITISEGTDNPTINVSSFITDGEGTIPAINITSANAGNATVAIPATTTVTSADPAWNGIIAAPTITTVSLPAESGQTKTLGTAIEVGFTGAKLSFDKAVRLLLPGQAGKRVGYVRTGISFTEITSTCAADNQATGDALATDGDCKINASNGTDLVIWTKHFTSFATYSQITNTTTTSSGGGGGIVGGGSDSLGYMVTYPRVEIKTPSPEPIYNIPPIHLEYISSEISSMLSSTFENNMARGMKSDDVSRLQALLSTDKEIYPEGFITGLFGGMTEKAVMAFQKKYGVSPVSGFVGPITRAKLAEIFGKETPPVIPTTPTVSAPPFTVSANFENNMAKGYKSDDVKRLQTVLFTDKEIYPEGLMTGFFGTSTENAVKTFQKKHGIIQTGIVGPITRAKILEMFGK